MMTYISRFALSLSHRKGPFYKDFFSKPPSSLTSMLWKPLTHGKFLTAYQPHAKVLNAFLLHVGFLISHAMVPPRLPSVQMCMLAGLLSIQIHVLPRHSSMQTNLLLTLPSVKDKLATQTSFRAGACFPLSIWLSVHTMSPELSF